jgi:hypothetical protein
MDLTCKIIRLADEDLPRIGHEIGVGEDELHAFLDVEASGSGYDRQNRLKALYEPHKAYSYASGTTRAKLVAQGLAYPNWGEKPYPSDSYPRIIACMAIDEDVAISATSWGIAQILGSNYVAAGYDTRHAMLQAFLELGEPEQLAAAVRFIRYNHLDDDLRAHNWAGFARGYNGPKYAVNGYNTKLAAAYAKWSRIKDTPWTPGAPNTLRDALDTPSNHPVDRIPPTVPIPPKVIPPAAPVPPKVTIPPKVPVPPLSPPPPPSKWWWQRAADNLRNAFPQDKK